jgi:hypothetical protein
MRWRGARFLSPMLTTGPVLMFQRYIITAHLLVVLVVGARCGRLWWESPAVDPVGVDGVEVR